MPEDEAIESMADDPNESVEHRLLSGIAGGDYWAAIVSNDELSFIDKLRVFLDEYTRRMLDSFRFVPANEFGVLDHVVTLPDGQSVLNPMRVVANGEGSEVRNAFRMCPLQTFWYHGCYLNPQNPR